MSQHIANERATPSDYETDTMTGYSYSPSERIVNTPSNVSDSITKQQRFDNLVDEMLYSSRKKQLDDRIRQQEQIRSVGGNSQQINIRTLQEQQMNNRLKQQQEETQINETQRNIGNTYQQINDDNPISNEQPVETFRPFYRRYSFEPSVNRSSIIIGIVVIFVLFVMLQMYVVQKKIETLLMLELQSRKQYV